MGVLTERLNQKGRLLCDGAMGTLLIAKGLQPTECPEEWCISHPEVLRAIHGAYAAAGADLITTHSFGGSPQKLAKFGMADRTEEFNRAAAQLAAAAAPDCLIMGSVGPTGEMLAPMGTADPDELRAGFERQITGLLAGGADVILIETFLDLNEAVLAVEAARKVAPQTEIGATMSFNATPKGFHTVMGVSPAQAVQALTDAGARVVGSNCGNGGEQMVPLTAEFARQTEMPLLIQANAGLPQLVDGKTVYNESPQDMAAWAAQILDAGAAIIGGCCGSTPEHIATLRSLLDKTS